MLEMEIDADAFNNLKPAQQMAYTKDDETGKYNVTVAGALKYADEMAQHKDRAVSSRGKMNDKLEIAQARIDELLELAENGSGGNGSGGGNFETLYNQAKTKIATLETELNDEKTKHVEDKKATKRETEIARLTAELCGAENPLMANYLKNRIDAIVDESGAVHVVVKDETGNQTANSIDNLKTEIAENAMFKPILKAPQSNGGGAGGGLGGGSGADDWAVAFDPKKPNLQKMAELQKTDPDRFVVEHKKFLELRQQI